MSNLEKNIKKYYSGKSLSEDKVQLLLNKTYYGKRNNYFRYAIASVLVLGLLFTFISFQKDSLEMRVAKEIAMNHNKQLDVEYSTDTLDSLQVKLTKLDFNLGKVNNFLSDDYELIGGRYCSIQGNLAAQLRIKNLKNNQIETLYVSGINDDLDKIKPSNLTYDGANIKVWKSDGLLYGKASSQ